MINEQDFAKMRKEFVEMDAEREDSIRKSREIIKLSKQIIYSVHRQDMKSAGVLSKEITRKVKDLVLAKPKTREEGYFRVALQEYVEAICLYEFERSGSLVERPKLDVESEHYLLGVADLTGELTRAAVNAVINSDFEKAMKIKELVSEIYFQMMQFDFRNGELRSKFDRIKYDVKKLEDLALEIKLKDLNKK